jgi:hypothetical protein
MLPRGERGGLSAYPYTGIVSGLVATAANTPLSASGGAGQPVDTLNLNISAGSARLDGQLVTLNAAIAGLKLLPLGTGVAINGNNTSYVVPVYLNPQRVIPALSSAPGSPNTNDIYIQTQTVTPNNGAPSHNLVVDIFQYNGSSWASYDAITAPPAWGHNNHPLNAIKSAIDASTSNNKSFSLTQESDLYWFSNFPPYVSKQSQAALRKSCSVLIATVTIATNSGGASTVTVVPYGDDQLSLI